jgi:sulfur carrier protein
MRVTINGDERELKAGVTLAEVLDELGVRSRDGVAVAVNEAVVGRARLREVHVEDGDAIEVIQAVAGG